MPRITWLLGLLALVGCVHQTPITPPASLQAHQAQVRQLDRWQIQGKLGIKAPGDSGSASLNWKQSPAAYQILLSAPLGQKHLEIIGSPNLVELHQSGQPPMSARSAEALIQKAMGWTLPVSQLSYWVRGIPAPKAKITQLQLTPDGLIGQLEQSDWQLSFSNYTNQHYRGETLVLPGKIVAVYQDLRLTLIIRRWQFAGDDQP